MLLRGFDRWMAERGLWIEIGEPFYTATLFGPEGPLLGVEAPTLSELAAETVRAADALQRQRGERWALRPNALVRTFEELDRRLEDEGRYLVLERFSAGDRKYRAFTVDFAGDRSESATGPTLAEAADLALLAVRLPPVRAKELLEREPEPPAPRRRGPAPGPAPRREAAPPISRELLEEALREHGSVSAASVALGVPRSTLRSYLARYGMASPDRPKKEEPSREAVLEALRTAPSITAAARSVGMNRASLDAYLAETGLLREQVEDAGSVEAAAHELGLPIETLRWYVEA